MNYDNLTKELLEMTRNKRPPLSRISGLTRGEMGVLLSLLFDGDNQDAGTLAELIGLTTGRIASVFKKLEQKEMITRCKDIKDKRKTIVSITDKGRTFIVDHSTKVFNSVKGMLISLGEEDAKEFIRLQRKVIEYHEKEGNDYGCIEK